MGASRALLRGGRVRPRPRRRASTGSATRSCASRTPRVSTTIVQRTDLALDRLRRAAARPGRRRDRERLLRRDRRAHPRGADDAGARSRGARRRSRADPILSLQSARRNRRMSKSSPDSFIPSVVSERISLHHRRRLARRQLWPWPRSWGSRSSSFGLRVVARRDNQYIGFFNDPMIFIWSLAWWPRALLSARTRSSSISSRAPGATQLGVDHLRCQASPSSCAADRCSSTPSPPTTSSPWPCRVRPAWQPCSCSAVGSTGVFWLSPARRVPVRLLELHAQPDRRGPTRT